MSGNCDVSIRVTNSRVERKLQTFNQKQVQVTHFLRKWWYSVLYILQSDQICVCKYFTKILKLYIFWPLNLGVMEMNTMRYSFFFFSKLRNSFSFWNKTFNFNSHQLHMQVKLLFWTRHKMLQTDKDKKRNIGEVRQLVF